MLEIRINDRQVTQLLEPIPETVIETLVINYNEMLLHLNPQLNQYAVPIGEWLYAATQKSNLILVNGVLMYKEDITKYTRK